MSGSRRFGIRAAALVAALALALGAGVMLRVSRGVFHRPTRLTAELSLGARFADSLESAVSFTSQRNLSSPDVLAALYLQRLRLGIGSPFRLVDYVLRDPLLRPEHRRLLAEGILARTSIGNAYHTPGEALQLLAPVPDAGRGNAHRRFIERVTEEAASPRAAELALRLSYGIGATSGIVSHRASAVALGAIAQARDRALAMRDVATLLAAARRQRVDPLDLVGTWRAERKFAVELPLQDPPSAEEERAALALLPRYTAQLDSLGIAPAVGAPKRSDLERDAAMAASALVAQRNAPPQAPIIVTLGGYTSYIVASGRSEADRSARTAFVQRSNNEESMTAEFARLEATVGPAPEAALAVLAAAVAMRAYAQETAWLPGESGPSPFELQSRLGLAELSFDKRVPETWRPYFTRMLDGVVRDVRTVFPSLDLTGLRVRFGDSPMRERALALHDPGTRTIYFPLTTSAGAMAHEFAHDLDWQAARRRYGVRGGYRTDRSVRQYQDDLTASVRRLASARPRRDSTSTAGERPTEAFARGVDWFVASALAHQGRLNGYVSAVQDEMLTGYASATAPRPGGGDADATLDALREISPVDPSLMAWYESTFGRGRRLGAAEAIRRVLMAPQPSFAGRSSPWQGFDAFQASSRMLRSSPEAGAGWRCLLSSPSLQGFDVDATKDAMQFAADERARGVIRRWGDYALTLSDASWRFRALGGAPWDGQIYEDAVREVRDAILWRAARIDDGRAGLDLAEHAERRAAWDHCAAEH